MSMPPSRAIDERQREPPFLLKPHARRDVCLLATLAR
jgi:hypothetical protein